MIKKNKKADKDKIKKKPTPEAIAKKQYMSNKDFYKELVACQKQKKMSNELGKMFMLLVSHYASKPNFSGYTYKDEMICTGIKACCEAFMKFKPRKSKNPFAFFTMVVHNSFLQTLQKEARQRRIRDKILVEHNMDPSASYMELERQEQESSVATKSNFGFNREKDESEDSSF